MGYNISALEGQNSGRDWPLIVTAIECTVCGAQPGEMCRTVGSKEGPTSAMVLNRGAARADWHVERKQAAAHAWYTRADAAKQPEEIAGDPEGKETATDAAVAGAEVSAHDEPSNVAAAPVESPAEETLGNA